MRPRFLFLFTLLMLCRFSNAQKIPEGYLLQYQQYFNDNKSLTDFVFNDPLSWGIFKANGNFFLQCPALDSMNSLPTASAILNKKIFGDFILEADIMSVPDSGGNYRLGLFLGYKDSSRYYYVQLASKYDSAKQGIFLLKDGVLARLTDCMTAQPLINDYKWHKIRIERNIVKRSIIVYIDNSPEPVLQAKDYEIVMGSIGFGTSSNSARFDNIKIWSQTFLDEWYK